MFDLRAILCGARASVLAATFAFLYGSAGAAHAADPGYVPNGPNFPKIALTEGPEGAAGLPQLKPPPPKGWDKQSIWNMQVVGFNDGQGRPSSDDGAVEDQNGRYIVYMTSTGGKGFNPLTGKVENSGTSLIDATDPAHPVYLANIPTTTEKGAPHVAVCGASKFPNAAKNGLSNRWFMIRHDGNEDWQVWETTHPSHPVLVSTIIGNGLNSHHAWWECDTGIAYMIFKQKGDGWHTSNHVFIYDLSNPAKPKFIRQFGLPGQQPAADVKTQKSCYDFPSDACYEGVHNPPIGTHDIYSAGVKKDRVFIGYGSSADGMFQILDRAKLLKGCNPTFNPAASADCATKPTQTDLLYPQISYLTANPQDGAHTFIPIFGVPIPQEQTNYLTGAPVRLDLAIGLSEQTANDCAPQKWKNPTIMDISNERAPWPISTPNVSQFPGNFCMKGARFGTHEMPRDIYAPYYGRLLIVSYFNAGLQIFDIRDPYNPRRVGYFIQAPNKNTITSCGTAKDMKTHCRKAAFSDLAEVDDRGYIYNMDRAGSGLTILKLTGDALKVATAPPWKAP